VVQGEERSEWIDKINFWKRIPAQVLNRYIPTVDLPWAPSIPPPHAGIRLSNKEALRQPCGVGAR
jgi:hypothetical protein